VINYVDVDPLDNQDDSFEVWLDKGTVKPYFTISQDDDLRIENVGYIPENSLQEFYRPLEKDAYIPNVVVRARLKKNGNKKLESEIHTGWLYLEDKEYYVYADPRTEILTYSSTPFYQNSTPYYCLNLSGVARQGAPILIKSIDKPETQLVQISFSDDATPGLISFLNKETIEARESNDLYLGYRNTYDVSVYDTIADAYVLQNGSFSTEKISVSSATPLILSPGREYEVSYRVRNSYTVNHENYDQNYNLYTNIVFDATPTTNAQQYEVTYENSIFGFSTPSGIYHAPNESVISEGFLYLTEKLYDYSGFYSQANPSYILDDGSKDYSIITIESYDANKNAKPYIDYGFIYDSNIINVEPSNITTNGEGFAYSRVKYVGSTPSTINNIPVTIHRTGDYSDSATINFEIIKSQKSLDKLQAEVSSRMIRANNSDSIRINGILKSADKSVSGVRVYYRIARTLNQALDKTEYSSVLSDNNRIILHRPYSLSNRCNAGLLVFGSRNWLQYRFGGHSRYYSR